MTSDDIIAALAARHSDTIYAAELSFDGGSRRADFWTLHPHQSTGFKAVVYEVKISRPDFRRDTHEKQRFARLFSDQFYYATPPGLVKKSEVPDWAGLVELHGDALKTIVVAPPRSKDAPTWQFVVELIRNSGNLNRDQSLLHQRAINAERQLATARQRIKERGLDPYFDFGIIT
jgi:hypothetical protein